MTSCDLSVINEDLANCDIVDTVICYKSLTDVIEDYLGVSLHTQLEVLGVADDEEIKSEVEECRKELQMEFITTKV